MRRLICAFVVCIGHKAGFLVMWLISFQKRCQIIICFKLLTFPITMTTYTYSLSESESLELLLSYSSSCLFLLNRAELVLTCRILFTYGNVRSFLQETGYLKKSCLFVTKSFHFVFNITANPRSDFYKTTGDVRWSCFFLQSLPGQTLLHLGQYFAPVDL